MTIKEDDGITWNSQHWRFFAEGGAHLVFKYIGPDDEFLSGKVLRFSKRQQIRVDLEEVYLKKYLLTRYTHPIAPVALSESFKFELLEMANKWRSPHRKIKDPSPTLTSPHLMVDYHQAEFSLEIKPKYSCALEFLPEKPSFNSIWHCIYCRFCNHNYSLKEALKTSKERYCPSRLFSCLRGDAVKGLESLLQRPRNNLRIFHYGKEIEPQFLPKDVIQELLLFLDDGALQLLAKALYFSWERVLKATNLEEISDEEIQFPIVLRDCSIIFGFHRKPVKSWTTNLIDLDAKPSSRLASYREEITKMKQGLNRYSGPIY